LINTGYKKDLTREDLFDIDEKELVNWNTVKLEQVWNPKAYE
jgi:hypothetical protein